jgi:hypothetical protein
VSPPVAAIRVSLGAAAAVAALALSLSASAAGATTYYYVDAPAAEGLSFSASGPVKPGRSKRITAGFSTRGLRAFTLYSARSSSRATRRRIRARIPRLGHVAVRFHERRTRRNVVHVIGRCKLVTVRRIGRFTGIIDVRGEGGYEGVDRRSARGGYERLQVHGCGRLQRPLSAARQPRSGILTSCTPGSRIGLVAVGGAPRSSIAALSQEVVGRLAIYRYAATERGVRGAFRIGPRYRTARVEPPGRWFDGSATYEDGRLTGDLTANFIGSPATPLTPGAARLTAGDGPVVARKCAPYLPTLVREPASAAVPSTLRAVSYRMRDEIGVSGGRTLAPVP